MSLFAQTKTIVVSYTKLESLDDLVKIGPPIKTIWTKVRNVAIQKKSALYIKQYGV